VRPVWFWTFWHWSLEHWRDGALLRSPLHGIGSHWDEWYRHEVPARDLREIRLVGEQVELQRAFVSWLVRRWAREATWQGQAPDVRFVLSQLAQVPPFDRWSAMDRYRSSFGRSGVSAIVLTGEGSGDPDDVRTVEAVVLPRDPAEGARAVVTEGFEADPAELDAAWRAASSVLARAGRLRLLATWIVAGRRPHPAAVHALLTLAWLGVASGIGYLLLARDPGGRVVPIEASLLAVWLSLVGIAVVTGIAVALPAWREGGRWRVRLAASQVRLRMSGGLRVLGGSAGVAFALSVLLAEYRRAGVDRRTGGGWLWQRVFRALHQEAARWAATGVVAPDGTVHPVVLGPKLAASLRHPGITDLLVPRQPEGRQHAINRLGETVMPTGQQHSSRVEATGGLRLGYALGRRRLLGHRCGHLASALLALGRVTTPLHLATNLIALLVSAVMLVALPDVSSTLWPPPAPIVVGPTSPSPYFLWVSLDTRTPSHFAVVFESEFWSNRRANVAAFGGADPSVRAEMRFTRRTGETLATEEDGTVWIERRRRFLFREFGNGERVGRYSLSYLSRMGHD